MNMVVVVVIIMGAGFLLLCNTLQRRARDISRETVRPRGKQKEMKKPKKIQN